MRALVTLLTIIVVTSSAMAQYWVTTDGPPSPSTCMAVNSKGHVFVGTPFSKLYRTTDKGRTWDQLDRGIDDGGPNWYIVNQVVIDGKDHLYIAVNGMGILRSTDNGDNWQKVDIGFPISPQARMCVSVKNAAGNVTQIFAGHDAGASNLKARFSDNGGASFIEIPLGLPSGTSSLFDLFLSPNSDKMFVSVAYNKGLFRTVNRGQSWRRIDADGGGTNESDDLYQTFASDPQGRLYVGRNALPSSTVTKNAVVIRSSDDGETWEYLSNGWDNRDITNNRISSIAFDPNGDMWVGTEKNSGPFRSPNYGELFTVMTDGLPGDGSVAGIAVTQLGDVFIAPVGESVHKHQVSTGVSSDVPTIVRSVVAPNPAQDKIAVTLVTNGASSVRVDLISTTGEVVIDGVSVATDGQSEQKIWLSTASLPTGVFMVRAVANGRSTTTPVIIAR